MEPVCPSQEKEHYNAKRKIDRCEEIHNPSVKQKLFGRPLPNPKGFPLKKNLKSKVTGLDLAKYPDDKLFNMVPSQEGYWKDH
jgi:hypothetical protein